MSTPILTVIVPVYNGMPFLPETIASLLVQTYVDFRLLIVDDGSTDGSAAYLQTLSDPRIELRLQANQGLCDTMNQAIASVDSEFIARLDQDDLAFPDRLQRQMGFLTANPDYAAVLSNTTRITESGKALGHYQMQSAKPVFDYHPGREGCIVHSALCCRRQAILAVGGYRSLVAPVDDFDLLLRLWETHKIAVINQPLVKHRIHSQPTTFKTFKTFWHTQRKMRYVIKLAELRQSGQPEMSLAVFDRTIDQLSLWQEVTRSLQLRGQILFRRAGALISEGRIVQGGLNLVAAFCCNPRFTTSHLIALRKSEQR